MNNYTKRVCLLYRTDTTLPQDKPALDRQRDICLTFAEQYGWHPVREFWECFDDESGPEKTEDALLELRAGAEQKKFDVLLVPRFACIGRVPEESFYAAAFFERMGIEVWDTVEGRIVSRRISGPDFAVQQNMLDHDVRILRLYDGEELCSSIYADLTSQMVVVENQAVSPVKTAFGNNALPDWGDFQEFLSERCIPRQRSGLREYLETLGLEEYDPLAIIEKTGGQMAEDQQWLTIEVMK